MLWPFGGGRLILDHVVLIAEFPCFGSWSAHLSQGRCCCCSRRRQVFPIFSTQAFDMNISREAERSGRSWETGGKDETTVDGAFIVNALGEKQIISDVSKATIHHPYGFMAFTCLYMFIHVYTCLYMFIHVYTCLYHPFMVNFILTKTNCFMVILDTHLDFHQLSVEVPVPISSMIPWFRKLGNT